MDLHPIFVHFPIALLTIYALLEVIPVSRLYSKLPWDAVKTLLVVFGALGAGAAYLTGEAAEEALEGGSLDSLIETHSTFAVTTSIIFGVLALIRLFSWIRTEHPLLLGNYTKVIAVIDTIIRLVLRTPLRPLAALAGLIAITITGGLGGAIVYGPDIDPVVKFIYGLFF